MQVFITYPYLVIALITLLCAIAALCFLPQHRQIMVLSGLLVAPLALFAVQHVPWYWDPKVTCQFSLISPEDVIYCISLGMTTIFAAFCPYASRLRTAINPWRFTTRYFAFVAQGVIVTEVVRRAFGPYWVMHAVALNVAIGVGILLWLRPGMWRMAVAGALGYGLFHLLMMLIWKYFWPETLAYWNPAAQLPFTILGVPAFELVFALAFGLHWPLVFGWMCDVRLEPRGRNPGTGSNRHSSRIVYANS
jgi:hypothetical protein